MSIKKTKNWWKRPASQSWTLKLLLWILHYKKILLHISSSTDRLFDSHQPRERGCNCGKCWFPWGESPRKAENFTEWGVIARWCSVAYHLSYFQHTDETDIKGKTSKTGNWWALNIYLCFSYKLFNGKLDNLTIT
jgi:hypothetical protein